MRQKSTLKRVVEGQLRVHGIDLTALLAQAPHRSFIDIRQEIETRTGVALSARTLRRWAGELQLKEAS